MSSSPKITLAIPSLNQGKYLNETLSSVFSQSVEVEVFILDAGSTDDSLEIIQKWEPKLSGWRSHKDRGQAAAINEGIAMGTAPYVAWLNSDDIYLPHGLDKLHEALITSPAVPAVYGRAWNIDASGRKIRPYWTAPFSPRHLANRCFISQPATLIRRSAWERVSGLSDCLQMAFDYDLWWRLYHHFGNLLYLPDFIAGNRRYDETKTTLNRREHYREAMTLVKKHYGRVPVKWFLLKPIMVDLWLLQQRLKNAVQSK